MLSRWKYLAKLPGITISLTIIICVFHYYLFFGLAKPEIWSYLTCHKFFFAQGQVWRLFSYVLPHQNMSHLSMDIAYLVVVGGLAEHLWGKWYMLITWLLCGFLGGLAFIAWDSRFVYLLGSSAATHGLLASIVIWMTLCPGNRLKRILSGLVVAYLLYISIYAIHYGVMGWPMTVLSNAGWDHLGGVIMGIFLGFGRYVKNS
jgi:membrane associated rhomboid family serine protease